MNRDLPVLREALETWRTVVATGSASGAASGAAERYARIERHLRKLRRDPPSFDATDLDGVLSTLLSAQQMRQQIIEGNDLDVLIPTLRAFLYDAEESLEHKLATYPPRVRYAGPAILAELWGWAHLDTWPLYHPTALAALRRLGWALPARDYLAFAGAVADLRDFYLQHPALFADGGEGCPSLPIYLELDLFLDWAVEHLATSPTQPEASQTRPRRPRRRSHAIREFGAPYDPATPPAAAWPAQPLAAPDPERLAAAEQTIRERLALPEDVIRRAAAHLVAGRHLVLTGAPGTGKSHLATLLAEELFGYYPMVVTATAEWSAFDVVGGLVPIADEGGTLRYAVRPGVVYEALRHNWLLAEDGSVRRDGEGRPLRIGTTHESRQWPGVWLIIDELNRADVDKAFGDLFTALESASLRVPRAGTEPSMLIPFPPDFRLIATLNSRDRHFLFTLSDALKRRFAFVEVGMPPDEGAERAILLDRARAALAEQGLAVADATLEAALARLFPVARLIRAFHPLGSAPLLAALRYIGAAGQLGDAPLEVLVEEAIIAELLPQLEGLRPLPLLLVARLLEARPDAALDALDEALDHSYGDVGPLGALEALATLVDPALVARVAALASTPADPTTIEGAREVVGILREREADLTGLPVPRVAATLLSWWSERR